MMATFFSASLLDASFFQMGVQGAQAKALSFDRARITYATVDYNAGQPF